MERTTSTVQFKSNLQPINGPFQTDSKFLSEIHDPFALEEMEKKKIEFPTLIQEAEYNEAAVHCAYAFEGDYPFGTIVDENGSKKLVCRCTNMNCNYFAKCRPEFDESELLVAKDNALFREQVANIQAEREFKLSIAKGDLEAIKSCYSIKEKNIIRNDPPEEVASFYYNKIDTKRKDDRYVDSSFDDTTTASEGELSSTFDERKEDCTATSEFNGQGLFNTESELTREEDKELVVPSFDVFEEVIQSHIIQLEPEERTLVNAGPGTGKTWTLIEKLKYMITEMEVEPETILVLCFSRAAVEVVRNRLAIAAEQDELPLNWHQIEVRTFDSFATYMLAWMQEYRKDLLPEKYSLEYEKYDQRIRTSIDVISRFGDLLAEYKHLIVDEVQDLVGVRAEMVLALLRNLPASCGFTLLGDSCQALYDYLAVNDDEIMDSNGFYDSLFREYPKANYYSLEHNYRQGDVFGNYTVPYRAAILTGGASDRSFEANKLCKMLKDSGVNLKHFTEENVKPFKNKGSLGILTRTNGQALQISSWLRSEGIAHILQRPLASQELASWIAKILTNTETDVIERSDFCELFRSAFPAKGEDCNRFWEALINTQIDETNKYYEIEALLRGVLQNARSPLLFEEPVVKDNHIVVSNIHRAKGREFDSVLILDDVLNAMADEERNDVLEHKVCYVALTRPKKTIEKVSLKPQYIYISKDEIRRCFKAGGFANRRYLSHFEIGDSSDLDIRSLARDQETQNYIQSLKADTRLKLLKCPEETRAYVVYRIVPEEDEHMVLGYTTESFANSMKHAIQRVFNNYNSKILYKYYPNIFGEVYFDGLTTCVSASGYGIPGAKAIGGMHIWYGMNISGFAQMEKDRY